MGIHRGVGQEILDFIRGWRQTRDRKSDPPQPVGPLRFRGWFPAFFVQSGTDEGIHGVVHPSDFRHGRFDRRGKSPMRFVMGTLSHPALQQGDFLRGQGTVTVRRGHHFVSVGGHKALDQLAFVWSTRDEGLPFQSSLPHIQAELAFALGGIHPVTSEALRRQQRPHFEVIGQRGSVSRNQTSRSGQLEEHDTAKNAGKRGEALHE